MEYSGAGGKLINEKNQKQKISWHCRFKGVCYEIFLLKSFFMNLFPRVPEYYPFKVISHFLEPEPKLRIAATAPFYLSQTWRSLWTLLQF